MSEVASLEGSDSEELIGRIADEFTDRVNRGETPDVEEYAGRHPEFADVLRIVLPPIPILRRSGGRSDFQRTEATIACPDTLGEYRIVREIARGGMGIVYEAVQRSLGRRVALKVLPTHAVLDSKLRLRFEREARAAARLHHTNIVPVFGVGEQNGVHFYVMQFIEGQGLDRVLWKLRHIRTSASPPSTAESGEHAIQEHLALSIAYALLSNHTPTSDGDPVRFSPAPLTPSDSADSTGSSRSSMQLGRLTRPSDSSSDEPYCRGVARIGLQVAEALAYAHSLGVQHRDIKPSNLLLDTCGSVWVTDFGLAKIDSGPSSGHDRTSDDAGAVLDITQSGDVVGTLRYMAPEGLSGHFDKRSDVYSLGITLYEMLALRPAFQATERGCLIKQIIHEDPPPLRRIDRRIPRDLETIVLKATEKDPNRRYGRADELAEDLRRYLAYLPIQARRSSLPVRLARWCRRNPAVATLTFCVGALLIVLAVGGTVAAVNMRINLNRAELAERDLTSGIQELQATQQRLELSLDRVRDAEHEKTQRLFDSLVSGARASRWSGRTGQRFGSLQSLAEAAQLVAVLELGNDASRSLRNEAIACMALADAKITQEWVAIPPRHAEILQFDQKMQRYARSDLQGTISVRSVAGDQEIAQLPGSGSQAVFLLFSPGGDRLAAKYSRIPSGEKSNLIVWNCLTAERVFESPAGPANSAVAFSPDGRRLAVGCDKPARVHVYDLASGTEQWRMDCSTVPFCLAFSPDGLTLALSGTHLELRDAQSGSLTRSLSPTVSRELSWHPDGGLLAAACGHDIEVWNTTTGQKHMVLRGHQDNVVGVRFVGKGNVIASRSWSSVGCLWDVWTGRPLLRWPDFSVFHRGWDTDGFFDMPAGTQARLWDTNLGTEFRALRSDRITSRHHEMAISPDGRWLAVAADEGVGLWDLDSEVQLAFLDIGRTTGVAFHPTGRRLYTTSLRALYEWPLEFPDHERMDIGPASKLAVPEPLWKAQLDRAGQMLCVAGAGGGFIVDPNEPTRVLTRFAHPNTTIIAVSPDGRWVATGTWNGLGLRVWNAQSGKLELELLPDGRRVNVIFSPDGQLLVASDHGDVYAWDTASWELRYRVDGSLGIAFSPDGSLLAVNNTAQRIRLLAARTGEEIATLEAPGEDILGGLKFARDGGRLYVSAGSPSRVCLWDLRQIRAGLAAIGLDWDLATLPPSPPNLRSRPIDVHIEWGNARPSVPRSAN